MCIDEDTPVVARRKFNSGLREVAAIGIGLLLCAVLSCNTALPNLDGSKYNEVERLSAALPVPPTAAPAGEKVWTSKPTNAHVSRKYRCGAGYDAIKQFYLQTLTQSGWEFVGERELYQWGDSVGGKALDFRKGEYKVVIEYAGEMANKGWDYSVAVVWRR